MGSVKDRGASDKTARALPTATLDDRGPGRAKGGFSLLRRFSFLVLSLAGGVGAVATEARLSAYAATGGGAAQVSASPGVVALSLACCVAVAALLSWRDLRRDMRAFVSRWTEFAPAEERPPLPERLRTTLLERFHTLLHAAPWGDTRQTWRGWVCVVSVALSLVASVIADLGARTPADRPVAQWWWVGSIVLLIVAGVAWDWRQRWAKRLSFAELAQRGRDHLGGIALGVMLLVAALALRLPGLTDQPYVVHGDEAACGLEAFRWLNGGVPSLISVGWYGLPVAGYGFPALVMRVAGANLFGLRLSSVLLGVGAVLLLYALVREFAGRRVAFVAAALMAVSHLSIQFSRMGIHYIHAPFVVLLTLWQLARSLRLRSALAAVLAGGGLSLAVQVYFSARIVFAIIPLFLLGLLFFNRALLKDRLLMLGWLLMSFLIAFGPLGIYFLQDMDSLKARSAEVLILNMTDGMRAHLVSQFGTANLSTVLPRQLAAVPLLVGGLADQSLQYGPLYPMFDALVAALVTIGFFYALLHLKRPLCLLAVIWVVCTLVAGGVLTIDMPWWPRLLVMLPALCLLAALALEALLRAVQRAWLGLEWLLILAAPSRRLRALALGGLLALVVIGYSGGQSMHHYFVEYPQQVNGDGYRTAYTNIGRYLADLPSGTQVILFSDDSLIWDYSTLQFLAPQIRGQQVDSPKALQDALASRSSPVLVIVAPSKGADFETLRTTAGALPPGEYTVHAGAQGQLAFFTYRIGAARGRIY
jgi:4-amino-4-deoxy-L-arabinose transferase-like glycosyltransferase